MTERALEVLAHAARPGAVLRYLGLLAASLAVMMAVPFVVAAVLGEARAGLPYLAMAAALGGAGALLARARLPSTIQANEALVVTALAFALGAAALVWPFAAAGLAPVDALFEATSAITTTGLSTVADIGAMPASFLFARAWAQWYGGLAIVVLAVALALVPGAVAKRIAFEGEAGDLLGGAHARARRLLGVYAVLTVAAAAALWLLGVPAFDAVTHALSAVSTGGFSTRADSAAGLGGGAARAALALACVAGAISFALQYRVWREGPGPLWRDREVRALALVALAGFGALVLVRIAAGAGATLGGVGGAAFLALSAQTTAGFSTVPVAGLDGASKLVLMVQMAIGGDSGSTAGGIKIIRFLVALRLVQALFARTCLPAHAVFEPHYAGRALTPAEVQVIAGMVLLYLGVALVSWLAFLLGGLAPLDSLFEVVSALGTVGLSAGVTGPDLAPALKLVLCADMLMGRLELVAVLVLLYPRTWLGRRAERA